MLPPPRTPFNCWIDPEGAIFLVSCWGHSFFARDIVGGDIEDATEALMKRGWTRISMLSPQSFAYVSVHSSLRVSQKILDGVYGAYNMCQFEELHVWLERQGYFSAGNIP
jgi:hypothetical protein